MIAILSIHTFRKKNILKTGMSIFIKFVYIVLKFEKNLEIRFSISRNAVHRMQSILTEKTISH